MDGISTQGRPWKWDTVIRVQSWERSHQGKTTIWSIQGGESTRDAEGLLSWD